MWLTSRECISAIAYVFPVGFKIAQITSKGALIKMLHFSCFDLFVFIPCKYHGLLGGWMQCMRCPWHEKLPLLINKYVYVHGNRVGCKLVERNAPPPHLDMPSVLLFLFNNFTWSFLLPPSNTPATNKIIIKISHWHNITNPGPQVVADKRRTWHGEIWVFLLKMWSWF